MRRLINGLLVLLFIASFAEAAVVRLPIDVTSTQVFRNGQLAYTEIGNALNVETAPGIWQAANPQFLASALPNMAYEITGRHERAAFGTNLGLAWPIRLQAGLNGPVLKLKPTAIAYLSWPTKDWTVVRQIQAVVPSLQARTVRYMGAFAGADLIYRITAGQLDQDVEITSTAGWPTPASLGYDPATTWVVVATKLDLANYPVTIVASNDLVGQPTESTFNGASLDTEQGIEFRVAGRAIQKMGQSEAIDQVGQRQRIRKRLVKFNNAYYLLEGVPYAWLIGATLPVTIDYTTVSGSYTTNQSWSNTIYMSANVTFDSAADLTVAAGTVVKGAAGVSLTMNSIGSTITVNGTSGSPVYFTSSNDDTVGETIAGSSGTPVAGDWAGLIENSADANIVTTFTHFRYATTGVTCNAQYGYLSLTDTHIYSNSGDGISYFRCGNSPNPALNRVRLYSNQSDGIQFETGAQGETLNVKETWIYSNTVDGIRFAGWHTLSCVNCLITSNGSYGIVGGSSSYMTVKNSTIASNGNDGIERTGTFGTLTVLDTIFANNTGVGVDYAAGEGCSVTYSNNYNDTLDADCTLANNITTDPTFQSDCASPTQDWFLTVGSGAIDVGSASASSLSLASPYTTTNDAVTTDTGTVDLGWHYQTTNVTACATQQYWLVN